MVFILSGIGSEKLVIRKVKDCINLLVIDVACDEHHDILLTENYRRHVYQHINI